MALAAPPGGRAELHPVRLPALPILGSGGALGNGHAELSIEESDGGRVVRALLGELGEPLLSSTLLLPGEEEPMTEGWQIKEELDHWLDAVIDSGETRAGASRFAAGHGRHGAAAPADPTG